MNMELKVYRKILLIDPLRGLIHQGENLSERIVIVMDKMYENLDRSELTWAIREFTEKETIAEQTMSKVTDGDKVHLLWEVTSDFTAADGPVSIELRGTRGGGEVISVIAASDKLIIWPDVNQPYPPAPPLSEQVLAEVHETAEQAKQIVNAGINFKILGVYDTLENLQAEKPNPNVGDAYGVGIDPNIYVYVWDGAEWDKGQKLGGGGGAPVDTYTKAESDERYPLKTDVNEALQERYTKSEADNRFAEKSEPANVSSYKILATGDETLAVTWNGTTTQLGVENLDVGTEFVIGKDYAVYRSDDGSYSISLDADKTGVQKIGGFHYGVCRRVNAALQPINAAGVVRGSGWESNVYDGILPHSVWDQNHRPACDPRGMVYLGSGVWVDIYLCCDNQEGGLRSVYNVVPISGTDGLNWYDFVERALAVGKRLLTYREFCQMAYGSPQGLDDSNENAWTAKTNSGRQKTGYVRNAVSSIGCRDAVGNAWEWLDDNVVRAEHSKISGTGTFSQYDGGRANQAYTDGNGHSHATNNGAWGWDTISPFGAGYGNVYEYNDFSLTTLMGGGCRFDGAGAGARTVNLSYCPWIIRSHVGARCACNSL